MGGLSALASQLQLAGVRRAEGMSVARWTGVGKVGREEGGEMNEYKGVMRMEKYRAAMPVVRET
jgi:hypothetical protein